jgi:hypothetical protein
MTQEEIRLWYQNEPLPYALDGIIHDLREPLTAFRAVAGMIRLIATNSEACTSFTTVVLDTLSTTIEPAINEQLWQIRDVVANQSTEDSVPYERSQYVRSKSQVLHTKVRHIAQQIHRDTLILRQIMTRECETCFASLPAEAREAMEVLLESNCEKLLQRLIVLDEVIAQRLQTEFQAYD